MAQNRNLVLCLAVLVLQNITIIEAQNPDCPSQLECEKTVKCVKPEVACCNGLLTGTDNLGKVYLFRVGSCACCEKCEILQEEPPTPSLVIPGPGGYRKSKNISFYSKTFGSNENINTTTTDSNSKDA